MRAFPLIVLALTAFVAVAPPFRAGVSWFDAAAESRWHVDFDSADATESEAPALSVERWYPQIPDPGLVLSDGTAVSTHEFTGDVLIVAFWATWCEPCREELPTIEALQRALGADRIDVLTVNLRESGAVAAGFLASIGVDLHVALSTPAVERAFKIKSVPVVIVADSRRRVRGRWNGFHESTLEELSERVREVLSDEPEPRVELARVERGAGLLGARWMREGNGTIDHAAAIEGDEPAVLAVAGRTLYEYAPSGLVTRFRRVTFAPSRLLRSDIDGNGSAELVGYRPGGKRLVVYDEQLEIVRDTEFDAPVIDLTELPGSGRLVFASLDGIRELARDAGTSTLVHEGESAMELAVVDDAEATLVARIRSGKLLVHDGAMKVIHEPDIVAGSLVGDRAREGFAVLDAPAPAAVGRFLPGDVRQIAVADGGRLHLFDLSDGAERFRAAWPGITSIVALDADGDGRDELAVVSGDRLVLVGSVVE